MLANIMNMSGAIVPTDTLVGLLKSPYVHYSKVIPDGRILLFLTNGQTVTLWMDKR